MVTSLTRRSFNSSNRVVENLAEHSAATIAVAKANNVQYIDLNRASTDYVNAIGQTDAWKYNLAADDRTHLNLAGEKFFGNMVSYLISTSTILKLGEATSPYLAPNAAIVAAIKSGKFILP